MKFELNQLRTLAREVAARYNKDEAELMKIIKEVHQSKAFYKWGFSSLFEYCVQELMLSEANTSNFTAVAKKANEVPALVLAVETGELSISKARKIVPVVTRENHGEWLALAKTSTSRQIEKAVAIAQPQLLVKETMRFVAENVISMTTAFSEEEAELLKRVMDLESQRTRKASSRKEALVAALREYIDHHDPVVKAKRAEIRAQKNATHLLRKSVPRDRSMSVTKRFMPKGDLPFRLHSSTQYICVISGGVQSLVIEVGVALPVGLILITSFRDHLVVATL